MVTVLITGANRGIGLEFAKQFLERGDQVLATCRDPQTGADGLKALQPADKLSLYELDVKQESSMTALAAALGNQPVDILINNAGVYGPRNSALTALEYDPWAEVMQVNAIAPLLLTRHLMKNLQAGKDKKLIYITSKMGSIADNQGGGSYIYRSSKAALNAAVRSLAIDLAGDGFQAALLHPGWVQTDMGGSSALINTETSVKGMMKIIDGLTPKNSGAFFAYDNKEIPW